MASTSSDNGRPSNVGTASRPTAAGNKGYTSAPHIPPQYQLVLDVRGDDTLTSDGQGKIFPIVGAVPQHYNISLSSQWDAPYANTNVFDKAAGGAAALAGGRVGAGINAVRNSGAGGAIAGAFGVSTKLKSQTVQVWQGSSGLSFSFDLVFHAKTNSETDVRDKHIALLKLAAPSEGPGGILLAPGPTLVDQIFEGRKITLAIGTYIFLDNIVIKSVGTDIESLCDEKGIPIAMTINVEIESLYSSFTVQDIEKAFRGGK